MASLVILKILHKQKWPHYLAKLRCRFTSYGYSPMHLQPCYRALGSGEGEITKSEVYSISLQLFSGLMSEEQQRVATGLAELLQSVGSKLSA